MQQHGRTHLKCLPDHRLQVASLFVSVAHKLSERPVDLELVDVDAAVGQLNRWHVVLGRHAGSGHGPSIGLAPHPL